MKRLLIFLIFFPVVSTFGQSNCAIDFIPNSNEIFYNQNVIDSILEPSKYNAFFLGESHTIDFEPEFKLNFIKHLNSKYGVKDIFMEIGYSAAYFFNLYLQTGDTSILKTNRLPYLWGQYKTFWRKLYAYNKLLPDSLKIIIHGIDFERTEISKFLEKARDTTLVIPHYLQKTFEEIHTLSSNKNLFFNDKEFANIVSRLKETFLKNKKDFKLLYGNNFKALNNALTNPTPTTSRVNPRNKIWFKNIREIIIENKIKKFIGFFGGAHTRYNNKTSLTVSIKNSNFFKGNILNIATVYNHFISTGGPNKILEFGYKEQEVFETFYNKTCRATIVKSAIVPKLTFKTASDFIIFAKEIVDR